MKKHGLGKAGIWFAAAELLLVASALVLGIFSVYKTISLVLFSAAMLPALYAALAVYSRKNIKTGRVLTIALSALLVIGLGLFAVAEILVIDSSHTDKNPEAPYLIVLGAGVDGTQPSLSLYNRLTAAKAYLEEFPKTIAIVSGAQGPGEDISEAECMRRWLTENGISPERIIMEENSRSTKENIDNSLAIIHTYSNDPNNVVAILSSEYHLYRAKCAAESAGAFPLGVAARTSNPILMINYFIREALGVVYLWIM